MKKAVAYLQPFLEAEKAATGASSARARVLMATVKGDVHDIGKNIVGVVLGCNNYEIIDLGVMVPAERILREARERDVQLIGLSGLITPSLDEMVHVAREMKRQGFTIPVLIGGATTSRKHTAVKIAPEYPGPMVHVVDASRAVDVVGNIVSPALSGPFLSDVRAEYEALRRTYEGRDVAVTVPYSEAKARRPALAWNGETIPRPGFLGARTVATIGLDELLPYIDWTPFFHAWELKGTYPRLRRASCSTTLRSSSPGSSTSACSTPSASTASSPPTPPATTSCSGKTNRKAPSARGSTSSGSRWRKPTASRCSRWPISSPRAKPASSITWERSR
jgi:5-methyltetrahydrofolate--homocysteine methyltransferase